MTHIQNRRMGRFEITWEAINDFPDAVRAIMSHVIPINTEIRFDKQVVEYLVLCDEFDELPEGESAPAYDIEFDPDTEILTWVKVE